MADGRQREKNQEIRDLPSTLQDGNQIKPPKLGFTLLDNQLVLEEREDSRTV